MQVDDQSIRMVLIQKPGNFSVGAIPGGTASPSCGPIQVDAACTILGGGGGSLPLPGQTPRQAPWKLGFMQARILEINWAFYRGVQQNDGCVLRDAAAQQSLQICRDYAGARSGHVFYEGSGKEADNYGVPGPKLNPPWNVLFSFGDQPQSDVPSSVINPQTNAKNYLDEGRLAMAFVTTMTELAAPSRFVHHRHFMWSLIWHYKAAGGPAALGKGPYKLLPGSGFWISGFNRGAPTQTKHRAVLDDPTLTLSCNDVAQNASVAQHVDSGWKRFPLMDAKDKVF